MPERTTAETKPAPKKSSPRSAEAITVERLEFLNVAKMRRLADLLHAEHRPTFDLLLSELRHVEERAG